MFSPGKGIADTVVDDIADQAGIGKGTLYLYFRSKEDIYMAALLEDARRFNTATRERMQQVDSWQDAVASIRYGPDGTPGDKPGLPSHIPG